MAKDTSEPLPRRFEAIKQVDIPQGRGGKHQEIIGELVRNLQQLNPGRALKVPIAALPDSKENIRAALSRATHQKGIEVATSSDRDFLYIWRVEPDATE